jgi:hypothetical protein
MFSFIGRVFTCDGETWHGEFSEDLQYQGVSAHTETEFDLTVEETGAGGEVEFGAEGAWVADGQSIPFQDNLLFKLLFEKGPIATIDMTSTGGVLLMGGQSIPVPQALPATTGELKLPVLPYISCKLE